MSALPKAVSASGIPGDAKAPVPLRDPAFVVIPAAAWTWTAVIAAVLLLKALGDNPPEYYFDIRWIITAAALFAIYAAFAQERLGWVVAFGAVAVLFNPVALVQLDRFVWLWVDALSAVVFLAGALLLRWDINRPWFLAAADVANWLLGAAIWTPLAVMFLHILIAAAVLPLTHVLAGGGTPIDKWLDHRNGLPVRVAVASVIGVWLSYFAYTAFEVIRALPRIGEVASPPPGSSNRKE